MYCMGRVCPNILANYEVVLRNMQEGIKIDAHVWGKVLDEYRKQYVAEFGAQSASDSTNAVPMEKDEFIHKYAHNVRFWMDRMPAIDLEHQRMPSDKSIAEHAICTNALAELRKHVAQKGVALQVEQLAGTPCSPKID